MCCRRTLRLVPLIAACAVLFASALHAQVPRRFEKCVDHPTLAEEFQAATNPTLADETKEVKSLPKVHIAAVAFKGADDLPESAKGEMTRRLKGPFYDPDDGWLEASQEIVRDALRERGYFFAQTTAKTSVLSGDHNVERVAVTFQLSEGRQYRLREIRFAHARVFPPSELRKYFPLQDGELFSITAIRKGMEAITWLYGTQGYLNFTPSPEIWPDNENLHISVLMDLTEGQQFRVGSVEFLGLDRQLSGPTLKTKLVPGQVFNPQWVKDVLSENKSVLPADPSPWNDVEIRQDSKKDTVAIVFDFLHCP